MKLSLPKIIETYVQASNNGELDTMISCFSRDAVVHDEGETHTGHTDIGDWLVSTRSKYDFKSEPLGFEGNNTSMRLSAKVSGNFPGSPVVLNYHFVVKTDLIQSLRIG